MLGLDDLSKIGFGTGSLDVNNREHHSALDSALAAGCNVIDTAPNYIFGNAEELIGECLRKTDRNKLFLMTKAGYLEGIPKKVIGDTFAHLTDGIHQLENEELFSIHPDVLRYQIERSCERMGIGRVDGFFLHNPHHIADGRISELEIRSAFECLEELADKGLVRYYGISSSEVSMTRNDTLNIRNLTRIAHDVSSRNRLKLFQFPLNIIENQLLEKGEDGVSLIDYCKLNGYKTFSNRPFNAYLPNGKLLRLASSKIKEGDMQIDEGILNEVIEQTVELLGEDQKSVELKYVLKSLNQKIHKFSSERAVEHFFSANVSLGSIVQGPPGKIKRNICEIKRIMLRVATTNMKVLTKLFYDQMFPDLDIIESDYAAIAIQYCQQKGVDCVLAGMRDQSYVKDVSGLML